MALHLRNPHSILAALETRPDEVLQITLPRGLESAGEGWSKVAALARKHGVSISSASPQGRGAGRPERGPSRGQRESGDGRESIAEAQVREREGLSAEELFSGASDRRGGRGLWLALDNLQDPHNVGAIFRAAAFFGVEGILLTQDRSAPLSGTVYDVASGGMEYVPFAIQANLQNAFRIAKDAGLWILGTSEHAHDNLASIQRDRPWLLVLGNEEKGMRRLTEESCDVLCKVPPQGQVTSLNVSVAAGIFISTLTSSSAGSS